MVRQTQRQNCEKHLLFFFVAGEGKKIQTGNVLFFYFCYCLYNDGI